MTLKEFCNDFALLYKINQRTCAVNIKVCFLGKFHISVNGTVISENNWKTKKAEGILKYLLLHKNRTINRETLMELFWPQSYKKSASTSLRAALYELRKVLSVYGIVIEGNDSLIHESSNGLQIKNKNNLIIDTDTFLEHHKDLKKLSFSETDKLKRTAILERMVSIYNGNLLENDIYEDWTFFEREELKSIYLKSALSLVKIYTERKEDEKIENLLLKTLYLDPYNEEACFFLLNFYISTNQRGRAIKLYQTFKKRLRKALGIEPDKKLEDIKNLAYR
ncbi:BTAD domain-containing putative transcriptional regulator [Petroclostridium sp. X23]|uniref:AfsR/SARP family transcriptional regulator n=1 Tax=Petroclostridium sp. X23 TaxID=3045146 RepID=UPI0024AC8B49|nr:BTAD domain-containing putative transcriptional regulator [Petroclostridium sp. X23]WHH56932.1 BTAD domain-containing putative transcriptional regulator [Petroclostridium sp. X23]